MTEINNKDLQDLLQYFAKNTYKAKDADNNAQAIMQRCILLAELDYTHSIVNNNNGDLSAHYPSHLIILEYEKQHILTNGETPPPHPVPCTRTTETIYESLYDMGKLKEVIKNARVARCRSRFPLPVILYKGRYVCRSATLSGGAEIYGRSSYDFLFANNETTANEATIEEGTKESEIPKDRQSISDLCDKVRSQDINLLKMLNVGTIIDFMVEKKKVKFGMNVTSSEKVDKGNRYSEFTLVSLPYPGCEFFKEFRGNNYFAKNLFFDWSQTYVDADIGIPKDTVSSQLRVEWDQYRNWDLINLTQNYFKLILKYLTESSNGLLIHCISGWDRTPLFISLLRISLWADGVIHTSLNAVQLLYFTIAYDWMLFGHDLQDRLAKGEEIFYFCFDFIRHILDDEFSVNKRLSANLRHAPVLRTDSDSQLDNVMFEIEPVAPQPLSTVSSNVSLNSISSGVSRDSRDSQDNVPPLIFHNSPPDDAHSNGNMVHLYYKAAMIESISSNSSCAGSNNSQSSSRSPLPTSANDRMNSRTSPVAVPMPVPRCRQRNESSSSAGSWQIVSTTGSLHGTTNGPTLSDGMGPCPCTRCNSSVFPGSNSSAYGQVSQESSTTVVEDEGMCLSANRRSKLHSLREVFSSVYSQTVGLRMKDNSERGIGQLIGNIAEKVGILSVQRAPL